MTDLELKVFRLLLKHDSCGTSTRSVDKALKLLSRAKRQAELAITAKEAQMVMDLIKLRDGLNV